VVGLVGHLAKEMQVRREVTAALVIEVIKQIKVMAVGLSVIAKFFGIAYRVVARSGAERNSASAC